MKVVLRINSGRINRLDGDMSKASIVPAPAVCLLLLRVFYVSDRKRSRARRVRGRWMMMLGQSIKFYEDEQLAAAAVEIIIEGGRPMPAVLADFRAASGQTYSVMACRTHGPWWVDRGWSPTAPMRDAWDEAVIPTFSGWPISITISLLSAQLRTRCDCR